MNEPVRRLIKPTTPRTVHLLNLRGVLPAPVQAEATTESAFVQFAALCAATKSIASQPETIELEPGKTYTPDYRLETMDGRMSIWEVKLEARIPKYRDLFDLAARHLARRGTEFFVISEKTLRRKQRHLDVSRVLRYAKAHYPVSDVQRVAQYLHERPKGAAIAELLTALNVTRELLFHMIARRAITFQATLSLAPTTQLIHVDHLENKNALHLARWLGVSPWRADV